MTGSPGETEFVPTRATALVCTKDRPDMLGACLDRLNASLSAEDELLLVEAPGAGPAPPGLPWGDHRFRRTVADRPGKSYQLNVGIRAARGSLILLTDDDVKVPSGWALAMIQPFDDPAVGLVCGRVQGLTTAPGSDDPEPVADGEAPLETWKFAHGAAMAVRRTAALDAGGFDERLGPGAHAVGEDHDFLLRVREAGWKVFVSSAPPARHEEWRSAAADYANALAYERAGGAIIGAAIRRGAPQRWRLLRGRLAYQRQLLATNHRFGARGLVAFAGGLLYGLRLKRHAYLDRAEPVSVGPG